MALFAGNVNAQSSWDFSTISDADKTAMAADADWVFDSEKSRYGYTKELSAAALVANGSELACTSGLKFTADAPKDGTIGKARVRVNYGESRLELNGTNIVLTIPSLKAGQKITVVCKTGSSKTARGLYAGNVTAVSGSFNTKTTDQVTNVGTVTADGDVTLTTTDGGINIFSIKVEAASSTDPSDPSTPTTSYNNVSLNTNVNQMRLHLADGGINYYNTSDVNVAIDKAEGTVTVTPISGTWSDVYTKTVSTIDFAKAASTGGDGEITAKGIEITEAKGWYESAYVKWNLIDGATSYNVYVKGGKYSDYTKIDEQLVRNYGTYGRADVLGLVSGTYSIKVVAVNADGEQASVYGEATDMNVINYSREGFAHFNYSSGVGAYNNDGSLKSGGKVLYVTANTAKTVTTDVITSNKGTKTTTTGLQAILDAYQKGYDTTPLAIRIIGKVTLDDLDKISSSEEGLQIKGKNGYNEMNITLEGVGDDATVYGFGFLIRNCTSIEFRNFAIMRCLDDALSFDTENSHCWVHHMDLFYGKKGSAADQAKGDGTIDMKGNSQYITVDNNHFWDSGKASMCGMKEETGENWITYHHNWFDHSDSRHPRIRTMSVHLYNNYFDHNDVYGIGATTGSSVFVDRNYFGDAYRPMMSSGQGTDAKGNGTFSGETGGMIKAYGNIMSDKTSNFSYITYADDNTSFDAYEVSSATEQVPSSVKTLSGGTAYNNFDTNSSQIYSYTADAAADVPAKVKGFYGAGRLNHGDIDYTIPDETVIDEDKHHQPLPALANLIDSYTSSLKGIFGDESASSGENGSGDSGSGSGSDSGSDSGTTDNDSTTIDGTVLCSFDASGNPSASQVTCVQKAIKKNASVTVDGTTYSNCLKVDGKETVTITIDTQVTMTVYYDTTGTTSATTSKIDGTKVSITSNVLTTTLAAGSHTITKGDGEAAIGLIKLVPVTE